jgi:hypothetical protein
VQQVTRSCHTATGAVNTDFVTSKARSHEYRTPIGEIAPDPRTL